MHPDFGAMRRLHERGPSSRGVAVDMNGATLGPNCVLVRLTAEGYRCVSRDEAATIQALVIDREDDPDWLFRQCHRIATALTEQNVALAQIYGMGIPIIELESEQLLKLANIPPFVKANFNPDQPRDAHGRWTEQGGIVSEMPSMPIPRSTPGSKVPIAPHPLPQQLAADNQRENKMVTDIIVQLRLSKDQRQILHREISGQGLTYKQILDLAKDMFDK